MLTMADKRRKLSERNNVGEDEAGGDRGKAGNVFTEELKQQTGDWEKGAVRLYDRAVSLDPTHVSFFLLRSFCLSEIGSFDAALADAQHVVQSWPDRPDGFFVKEKALAGLRKYLEAADAQTRVNELVGDTGDDLCHIVRQQIQRDHVIWLSCKELDSGLSDSSSVKDNALVDDKKSSRKLKPVVKEERKRSEKRRSPPEQQQPTSTSRPVVAAKAIESKVMKVEKTPVVAKKHKSESPPIRRPQKDREPDDSDHFFVVDDIKHYERDSDLNFSPAHNPPHTPPAGPRSPHSPDEPFSQKQRQRSDRRNSSQTFAPHSYDRKRRIDRSSRSPVRRVSSRSPVHSSNRRNERTAARRSRSKSQGVDRSELPVNIYRFTAIRMRNIYPAIQTKLLETVAAKYGRVLDIETKDKEAIVTFADPESPRRAIRDLHDTFVPRVSHFNDKLHVRFALGTNQDKFHMRNVKRIECDECHFYRTTGCDDLTCPEKHIPFNAGIDLQPWMRRQT